MQGLHLGGGCSTAGAHLRLQVVLFADLGDAVFQRGLGRLFGLQVAAQCLNMRWCMKYWLMAVSSFFRWAWR